MAFRTKESFFGSQSISFPLSTERRCKGVPGVVIRKVRTRVKSTRPLLASSVRQAERTEARPLQDSEAFSPGCG